MATEKPCAQETINFWKKFERDLLETAFSCTAYTIKNVVIAAFL